MGSESIIYVCGCIMQTEDEARREPECVLNMEMLLGSRISAAVTLRKLLGLPSAHTNVFRLVNSEGDWQVHILDGWKSAFCVCWLGPLIACVDSQHQGSTEIENDFTVNNRNITGYRLSVVIVDVLGEHVVVASSAAWVERHMTTIEQALGKAIKTSHMSWRQSVEILKEEACKLMLRRTLHWILDGMHDFEVVENGVQYLASLGGQKTRFYADQWDRRLLLRSITNGWAVLDLCRYSDGFALNAALGGASHTTSVDSFSSALELTKANVSLNQVDAKLINFVKVDVGEYMKSALGSGMK